MLLEEVIDSVFTMSEALGLSVLPITEENI